MKQLAEKPFALLGVHGLAYEPKQLKAVMEKEKLNWRTFADRRIIAPKWSARGTPTYYVLDHKGIIRYRELRGDVLSLAVARLVEAAEQAR